MKIRYLLAASVASIAATAAILPQTAQAQQITSGVQGTVTDTEGNVLPGATVTVVDTRTGSTRTGSTDANGSFRFGSLVSGGPYTVTVTASGFEGQSVEEQYINISGNTAYTFQLTSAASENVIIVSGARVNVQQLAVGPSLSFDQQTLEDFPSITRDVRDIIRIDPRVSLDRDNEVDRISCLGGNDRGNTFTVDGTIQADVFGLNGTPFAARNALPLPFDTIRETSVEFAPFDVEYSDFTGCLVNVVTKSGTNEFHGSAFFNYRDSGLRGNSIDGDDFSVDPFQEKRWGATLGGPIIPDRLFFFGGYEETDLGGANDFGPFGANFPNEANFATQAQFDEFSRIAGSVYGQETGGYPRTLPQSSVRYFGRLDAYITDGQRLEATYQRLEETNVEADVGADNLTGLNSFEDEGTVSDYYSVRLYSDWSDVLSTEIRLSRADVADVQGPVGGGEAQSDNPLVRLNVGVTGPGNDGILGNADDRAGVLSTGPGIFRSANQLNTNIDQIKVQANLDLDRHQIKIGADVNDLEVFNLFAVNATGSLYFSSLANFEAGILTDSTTLFPNAADIVAGRAYGADINAAPGGDINNAAASFSRRIYSIYFQDEFQATPQLNINTGLRVQWYDGDAPRENPEFIRRYRMSNAFSFSDLEPLWLPRLSATYEFENDGFLSNSSLTGGVGRFAGGDPVVYFSNAFSNNGFSTGLGTLTSSNCAALNAPAGPVDVVQNGQFTGLPQCVVDAGSDQASAGLADTQSTDPEFTIPSVWRANLGFATDIGAQGGFFSDWRLNLDYIYSRYVDTLNFVDLSQTPNITRGLNGFTADGRPIYAAIDPTDTDAVGCTATLDYSGGTPPVWRNVNAPCFNRIGRDDEIQLTNGPSYESHTASAILSKSFGSGLFTQGGSTRMTFGYAWTDASNNRNNGSSTATSSYDVTAAFDRQNPAVSTSNFETRHNITAAISLREEFIEDYSTRIGLFFSARSGRPYSLTFNNGGLFNDSASGNDNALVYVPTGVTDPNLAPTSNAAAVQSLIDYVDASGCDYTPGETIERNTCTNDWYYDLDLRFSQELPFVGSLTGLVKDRVELFFDFDNFLNFVDDGANVFRRRGGFQQTVELVDAGIDSAGRYVITNFNPNDQNSIGLSASIWRIQVGARYEF